MFKMIAAFTALAMLSVPVAAAAPCRSAKGKFVKCASVAAAKPVRCRDAKGHFKKC